MRVITTALVSLILATATFADDTSSTSEQLVSACGATPRADLEVDSEVATRGDLEKVNSRVVAFILQVGSFQNCVAALRAQAGVIPENDNLRLAAAVAASQEEKNEIVLAFNATVCEFNDVHGEQGYECDSGRWAEWRVRRAHRLAEAPATVRVAAAKARVPLTADGGTYKVPVTINGALTLHFVLDSGAADVSIPADVVLTLIRTGTLKKADFMGTQYYSLADGRTVPARTFRLKSLQVGDRTLRDVKGSVADVNGPLLLGQSFLSRFKSWSIDNATHSLRLD